ncbi:MAG: addiction module protein [Verrucomicrobia bacterium]|nr:addiction module protein [Verrucomicrobiota bacterium]
MNSTTAPALRDLSFSEKMLLVEDLRDELARQPNDIPLSASVKAELDRRYADYRANPAEGSSWDDAKRRVAWLRA